MRSAGGLAGVGGFVDIVQEMSQNEDETLTPELRQCFGPFFSRLHTSLPAFQEHLFLTDATSSHIFATEQNGEMHLKCTTALLVESQSLSWIVRSVPLVTVWQEHIT